MTPRYVLLLCVLLVPLVSVLPQPAEKLGIEAHDEPLPAGAALRVGSARMEHRGMRQLAFTPDGRYLASGGGSDGVCYLWDLATGKEVRRYPPLGTPPSSEPAVLSPDGAYVALSQPGDVRIVELASGRETARVAVKEVFQNNRTLLALSPGGKMLARVAFSGSSVLDAVLVDTASGRQLHQLNFFERINLYQLIFSPDGESLGWADYNYYRAGIHDVATGKRLRVHHVKGGGYCFAFGPDNHIVAGSYRNVLLWDSTNDEEIWEYEQESSSYYRTLAFSPDGSTLATNERNSVAFLDVATGELKQEIKDLETYLSALAFSPDGKKLAIGSTTGTIRIWDLVAGKECTPAQAPVLEPIAFAGPSLILARDPEENTLHHVDGKNGATVKKGNLPADSGGMAVAPCGKLLALLDKKNNVIQLWDIEKNTEKIKLSGEPNRELAQAVFSADSRYLAVSNLPSGIAVWDTTAGKRVHHLPQTFSGWSNSEIRAFKDFAFSAENRFLYCFTSQSTVVLWELASGQERCHVPVGTKKIGGLILSPNSRWLAAVPDGVTARVWDVHSGELKQLFTTGTGVLRDLAFSPDSKTLATGNSDGVIVLYDLNSGKEKRRFTGHRRAVEKLLFSPNGNTLVSASEDGTWLVWKLDVPTQATKPLAEEPPPGKTAPKVEHKAAGGDPLPAGSVQRVGTVRMGHPARVIQVAFTPDGRHLASLDEEKNCLVWDLAAGKEIRRYPSPKANPPDEIPILSANGGHIALSGPDQVRILDLITGRETAKLAIAEEFKEYQLVLALAAGGKMLARVVQKSNSDVVDAALVDTTTGQPIHQLHFPFPRPKLSKLIFSADGGSLGWSDTGSNRIGFHDVATGKRLRVHSLPKPITVAFGPGTRIASCNMDSVSVWDADSDETVVNFKEESFYRTVALSPDGSTLATSGNKNTVVLMEVATGQVQQELTGLAAPAYALAFAPDGKKLAIGDEDGALYIWDLATGKECTPIQYLSLEPHAFGSAAAILARDLRQDTIHHVNAINGKIVKSLPLPEHSGQMALAPCGKLAALHEEGKSFIQFWDVETNTARAKILLADDLTKLRQLVFSADGRYLAAAGSDSIIQVWNSGTGKEVQRLLHPALDLAFSADNRFLACRNHKDAAVLWELATGKERCRFAVGPVAYTDSRRPGSGSSREPVSRLVLSPDNRWLAMAAAGDTFRVWDTHSGQLAYVFAADAGRQQALAFSPCSKALAIGSAGGEVVLYNLLSGQKKRRFLGHRHAVTGLLFAPEGNTLVSASLDGTWLFWDLDGPPPVLAAEPLPENQLNALWDQLAGEAADAHQAIAELTRHHPDAVPYLKKKLPPASRVDPQRLRKLIADLDHISFAVREQASRELTSLEAEAIPALIEVITGKGGAEAHLRATKILEKVHLQALSPDNLRLRRVVEILEAIGTREAVALLQALADGAPHARLTLWAQEALLRHGATASGEQ